MALGAVSDKAHHLGAIFVDGDKAAIQFAQVKHSGHVVEDGFQQGRRVIQLGLGADGVIDIDVGAADMSDGAIGGQYGKAGIAFMALAVGVEHFHHGGAAGFQDFAVQILLDADNLGLRNTA